MRILIISPSYSDEKKSAYAFVHARAKIYQKFGNKVTVFVPSRRNFNYKFEGIRVYNGTDNSYSVLLKEFGPDVVAIHSPRYTMSKNPISMLNETRKKAPIIMWIHGIEAVVNAFHNYFSPWDFKGKIRNVLGGTLKVTILRFLIPKASAIVYVSKWMEQTAERYFVFRHPSSFIIPNPIDTSLFIYTSRAAGNKNRGISVRGLDWKYGTDIAIRAFSNFREPGLTILGTGVLEKYMRCLAEKCRSNVTFLTKHIEHNRMPELYTKFGYFVAPSRTEAQGVAMCEAMACGLPVVATNVGGIPEFIKDGVNGILVPPENPKALRNAIEQILTNEQLYDALSRNGAKFVAQNLSQDRIYNKEFEILRMCQELFERKR